TSDESRKDAGVTSDEFRNDTNDNPPNKRKRAH
ncbi:uncharacterized protein CDAR_423141, partial [Caerostris darwini]